MAPSLRVLLIWISATLASAQEAPWLSIRDDNGAWITLKEVSPQSEFWLRPQPSLDPPDQMSSCGNRSQLRLQVRLWSPQSLAAAKRALLTQGRCSSSCRVVPFMVDRLGLRDQRSQWQTANRWIFVSGPVPATHSFELRRDTARPADAHCRPTSLLMEMVEAGERTSPPRSRSPLIFTPADVQWARAFLRLPLSANTTVSRHSLRRLARQLLTSKLETLEAVGERFSMGITPSVLREMELALVVRAVRRSRQRVDTNAARPPKSKIAADDPLFVLKSLAALGKFQILMPATSRPSQLIRVSLLDAREQATSPSKSDPSSESSPSQTQKIETLREQVQALESLVRNLLSKTKNGSLLPLPALPGRKQKRGDPTPDAASTPVVADCSDVKARGLGGGVFILRFNGRPVRCTDTGELVALDRTRGNVDFNRNWTEYRNGFGDPRSGDFWVGLRYLANYTDSGDRCMRLVMKPWRLALTERIAQYSSFDVDKEANLFGLSYAKFRGNVQDGFKDMKGQPFSTYDRDNDAYIGNCADSFGGGNWYRSCSEANIFGRHKYISNGDLNKLQPEATIGDPMCWKGLSKSQGSMCSPLVSVKMILSKADQMGIGRRIIYSQIASLTETCRSELKRLTVNTTGIYHITLGGGAGGRSSRSSHAAPGGRGALVRAKMLLKRGRKLVVVTGCGGAVAHTSGHGGNATWLVDDAQWKPILVAGGGGGAVGRISGLHGRAEESGGRAWWTRDLSMPKATDLLNPSPRYQAYGWSRCNRTNTTCTTGRHAKFLVYSMRIDHYGNYRRHNEYVNTNINGGGGGGGFQGGASGTNSFVAGGGGGSFCDLQQVMECRKEEGGNAHQVGFLVMEKPVCF